MLLQSHSSAPFLLSSQWNLFLQKFTISLMPGQVSPDNGNLTDPSVCPQKFTCPICFENLPGQESFITHCNHRFCIPCIVGCLGTIPLEDYTFTHPFLSSCWLTCPYCRTRGLLYFLFDETIVDVTKLSEDARDRLVESTKDQSIPQEWWEDY